MGKICWINGQPYSVGLPTGGEDKEDHENQWDELIGFLGEDCDHLFHIFRQYSWCQNEITFITTRRVTRGYSLSQPWFNCAPSATMPCLGFRPILTPLNMNTLKPDRSLLADIPDGRKIALTSLYMGGKPVDLSEEKGPNYNKGEEIILGNRDKNKNNWLYVIKHKDLLWADRNILVNISWDDLKEQGYTN